MKRLFVLIPALLLSSAWSQPWAPDDRLQDQIRNDPDRFSRSRTQMTDQEIEARAGAVQTVVKGLFLEGAKPEGAQLDIADPHPETGQTKASGTAPFGSFADSIKADIMTVSDRSEEPKEDQLISFEAVANPDETVTLLSAQWDDPQSAAVDAAPINEPNTPQMGVSALVPTLGLDQAAPAAPAALRPEAVKPATTREKQEAVPAAPEQSNPLAQNPPAQTPKPVSPGAVKPEPIRSVTLTGETRELFIVSKALAPALGSYSTSATLKNQDSPTPFVLLPLKNGGEVAITQAKETKTGVFEATVHGQAQAFPSDWRALIQNKNAAPADQPIQARVEVRSNNRVRVLKVDPSPLVLKGPAPASERGVRPSSRAPAKTGETTPIFSAALQETLLSLFTPSQQETEPAIRSLDAPRVGLIFNYDQKNAVTVIKENAADGPTPLTIQGSLSSFSQSVQAFVQDALQTQGGSALIGLNSPLEIAALASPEKVEITAVSALVERVNQPEPERIPLIQMAPEKPSSAPRQTDSSKPKPGEKLDPGSLKQASAGFLPEARILLTQAFPGSEGKPLSLQPVLPNRPHVASASPGPESKSRVTLMPSVNQEGERTLWLQASLSDLHPDWKKKAKTLIEKKEKSDNQNWVENILTGEGDGLFIIRVLKREEGMDVQLEDVKPDVEGEARLLLERLGLALEDVDFLMDQEQGLLTLLPHKALILPQGQRRVRLESGDGLLRFLVQPRQEAEKAPYTFYLDRTTLQLNQEALNALFPEGEKTNAVLTAHPSAKLFAVQAARTENGGATLSPITLPSSEK